MSTFQCDRKFASPGDRRQEDRQARDGVAARGGARQACEKLGNVIEQSAKAGRVAAILLVHAGTPAIEEVHVVAGLGKLCTRMFVPAAVTLNAVNEDDDAARFAGREVFAKFPA